MDLRRVQTAKSATRKILSMVDEWEDYRDEYGMVDGYADLDILKRTAKRAYSALKRFLSELGEHDEDAEE